MLAGKGVSPRFEAKMIAGQKFRGSSNVRFLSPLLDQVRQLSLIIFAGKIFSFM